MAALSSNLDLWYNVLMSESSETAIPRQIGVWNVVRLLGKGGMAEVYEVEDVRLGIRYALKLFTYARGRAEGARERFISEGRLLAKLDHPRLVRVYDVGEDEATGCPYFVMDLVLDPDGRPRTLAEVEAPDEDQVATWYEDLRDGLDYIHGRGILHRDLKLQNVLVGPDGHVVLSDFGIAKIFDPGLRADLGLSAEQTLIAEKGGQKTVMGSVGYMAPEVEMGVAASKQSDWYALGVLIFRLLTGVWCDARTDVAADLETFNPTWLQILPKLLHLNPSGRECPSWKEIERVRRDEESYKAEKAFTDARDKLRRAKRSKKWLVASLISTVTLTIGLGIYILLDPFAKGETLPPFEELCPIPSNVRWSDDDDAPSRIDYELAQVDAWVITHGLLADVTQGKMTRAKAVEAINRLAKLAGDDDEEEAVFAGHPEYTAVGDTELLAKMLRTMAANLAGKAER